jgi:hypothetical protein
MIRSAVSIWKAGVRAIGNSHQQEDGNDDAGYHDLETEARAAHPDGGRRANGRFA